RKIHSSSTELKWTQAAVKFISLGQTLRSSLLYSHLVPVPINFFGLLIHCIFPSLDDTG
uniref:Uncharacterized protein n=1 Tax=Zonotrichia albicollis TaxID=44394 RepID=A0A8D2M774_ZONAL